MSSITVKRLSYRQRKKEETVWTVCRYCGDDIPASASNHAYCGVQCKKESMREEMNDG